MKTSKATRGISVLILAALLLSACQGVSLRIPATASPSAQPIAVTPTRSIATATAAPAPSALPSTTAHIVPKAVSGKLLLQPSKTTLNARVDSEDSHGYQRVEVLDMERLTTVDMKQSSTTITGSLTTRVLQLLTKETWPDEIAHSAVYRMLGGSYLLYQFADATYTDCVKLRYGPDQDPFYQHQTPFEALLQVTQRFLYGSPVGEEELNSIPVRHYAIDAAASNAAAQASNSQEVRDTLGKLKLTGGDVYLAREGDYVVRINAEYSGTVTDLGLKGTVRLDFDLARPAGMSSLTLPVACANAEAREKLPKTVGKAQLLTVLPFYPLYDVEGGIMKSSATVVMKGVTEDGRAMGGSVSAQYTEDVANQRKSMAITGMDFAGIQELQDLAIPDVKSVTFYMLSDGAYLVIPGKSAKNTLCRSLIPERASEALDLFEPVSLVEEFADLAVLYGVPVRDEKVNGIAVAHYRLDAAATNDAMAKVTNAPNPLPQLVKGDAYIAKDGEYLVRLSAEYKGDAKSLGYKGVAKVQFDLSTPTRGVGIQLPAACQNAKPS